MKKGRNKRARRKPFDPCRDLIEVDNPFYQPGAPSQVKQRETATRSLRDDPLARLHARHQIGDGEFMAGRRWQALYEAAEIGGARGIDPSKDVVDGGRVAEMLTDRTVKAVKELARIDRALGQVNAALVREVLAERRAIERATLVVWIERDLGWPAAESIRHIRHQFRLALSVLAGEFGLAPRFPQAALT